MKKWDYGADGPRGPIDDPGRSGSQRPVTNVNIERNSNILSQYSTVTYNFRLFMIGPEDQENSSQDPRKATNQVTIAESGASDRYYINDVTIEHFAAPNRYTRNQTHRKIDLTITEPRGATLMDAIFGSAQNLGIPNYFNAPYYLEVSFVGYNEEGLTIDFGIDKVWSIRLLDLSMSVTNEGTNYQVSAIGYNDIAKSNEVNITPRMFKVEAGTIGEFFSELQKAWNDAEINDYSQLNPDSYKFKVDPKIKDFSIKNHNVELDPRTKDDVLSITSSKSGTKKVVQISPGMDISAIVESLFVSNPEAAKEILDGDLNNYLDSKKRKVTKPFWTIDTDVKIKGYDYLRNDYSYEYIFYVKKYETMRPQINPKTYQDLNDPEAQKVRLRRLNIEKIYDYIYSGENTEVLNFDIDINMAWVASLPLYQGYNMITPKDMGQKVEKSDKKWSKRFQEYRDTLERYQSSVQRSEDKPVTPGSTQREQFTGIIEGEPIGEQSTLERRLDEQRDQLQSNVSSSQRIRDSLNVPDIGVQYASEFIGKSANTAFASKLQPLPVSLISSGDRVESDFRNMFEGTQEEYPSVLSAYLNQIYTDSGKDLHRIELEIRGDPWWLALSNIEQVRLNENNLGSGTRNSFSITSENDNLILLNFKIPIEINSETGLLEYSRSNIVTAIYQVIKITSSFSGGQFTQTLECVRDPATNLAVVDNPEAEIQNDER